MSKIIDTDVAVFGAGPAGIAAAWQAGKSGKNVYLIESTDRIGGVMGSCPGMMLGAGYPLGHSVGGFFEEFVNRMYTATPPVAERRVCSLENFGDEVVYCSEYAITILYDMLKESNVRIMLGCIPHTVHAENGTITGVGCMNMAEAFTLKAKTYLDCTGNGEVAHRAGVKSQKGNSDGLMMGASLTFFMENVDTDVVFSNNSDPYFEKCAAQGILENKIHKSIPQIYMLPGFRNRSVFFNTVTVTGVDGTDPESIAEGTVVARKRVIQLADFLKDNVPGFENSWINSIGPAVGIRETRKMEGLYQLTYDDVFSARKFEDGIVACNNPLDEVFRDENTTYYSHDAALDEGYYTIPLSSLIPKNIKNLMFAGRCMSVDEKAFASVRGMPQCMLMGQAIAVTASLAQAQECAVQDVDRKKVNEIMSSFGVWGI